MERNNKLTFILGLTLFVLVLIGVCLAILINPEENHSWLSSFMPVIVMTGFFIFMIAAGLVVFSLIRFKC